MEVTLSGMVMDVKDEQFLKALSPIVVTLSGIVINIFPAGQQVNLV